VLLGVTGSGKTFTMAKLIEQADRPALVLAHNKTLGCAAVSRFKGFLSGERLELFRQLLRFYQPERMCLRGYLHRQGSDHQRRAGQAAHERDAVSLFERRDVVIVASVSCIYGLGSPKPTTACWSCWKKGHQTSREALLRRFVDIQYERSEDLRRGTFRVRGDMIEIYPTYEDQGYRIEMWGDQIDALRQIDPVTEKCARGRRICSRVPIYPKTH